jgi:small subunit ribosomal protein S4
MALPGENTKFYETPNHPYQGERIAEESDLVSRYGLKNKQELWRAQSELRNFRREARRLLGQTGDVSGEEFVSRLQRLGVLSTQEGLDDVLSLDVTDVLERRLQTLVYRDGLANTVGQARQFVSHGHITVDGARVTEPSYKVPADEEDALAFDERSELTDELHPARAGAQE